MSAVSVIPLSFIADALKGKYAVIPAPNVGNPRINMPLFEVEGCGYTLPKMLIENADDAELCGWLRAAKVGDRFPSIVSCSRVA